jgi:putative phosphoesterase
MDIAILSDIHGNLLALEAILEEIKNIDQIIVLGDMITDFPENTNSIIDIIKEKANYIIKGNREQYLLDMKGITKRYKQFLILEETLEKMTKENFEFISLLPQQIAIKYDNILSLKCVHGSPDSISEIMYADHEDRNKIILGNVDENILLCGHNHQQWYKKINNKIILSSGSVGINFNGKKTAQYGIIKYKNNCLDCELKEVEYDFNSLKNKVKEENQWARLCISSIEKGKNLTLDFLDELKTKGNGYPVSNEIWDEQFNEWIRNGKL